MVVRCGPILRKAFSPVCLDRSSRLLTNAPWPRESDLTGKDNDH
jgi:hypothetical protein